MDVTNPADHPRRAIRIWLYAVAALVVLMVVVGGATRLTDSGLSIVEWRPVTGTLPPLGEADWLAEFDKYKTSSEYELVNKGMNLNEFKRIYWWEWGHRFLGRAIGAAFLLPFLFFLLRGWIDPGLQRRLWLIFALGGLQGAIGWWMVRSGLTGRVDVLPERLAVHLSAACAILIAIVWTARSLVPAHSTDAGSRRGFFTAITILVLIMVQIALGGLTAGLKAGLIYDTWPLIDGALVPARESLFFIEPAWRNFLDNHLTVQFAHRMVAYTLLVVAVLHVVDCIRHGSRMHARSAITLALLIGIQAVIGIATLLWHVPLLLALVHQAVAMVVLVAATLHTRDVRATRGGSIALYFRQRRNHAAAATN
jgi:cytochrome c oxidase assembly protein subunit 15